MWHKEYEWVRRVKMWLKDGCDEARIFVYIREGRRAIVTTAVLLALLIQFGCWCVFDSCSSQCNKVWYYKLRETDECEWWIWVRQPAVGSASMWEGARGGGWASVGAALAAVCLSCISCFLHSNVVCIHTQLMPIRYSKYVQRFDIARVYIDQRSMYRRLVRPASGDR